MRDMANSGNLWRHKKGAKMSNETQGYPDLDLCIGYEWHRNSGVKPDFDGLVMVRFGNHHNSSVAHVGKFNWELGGASQISEWARWTS